MARAPKKKSDAAEAAPIDQGIAIVKNNVGKVTQVLGAVVDVQFPQDLPNMLNALQTKVEDRTLVLEVAQHLG
jgi:hypothetical protein